MKYLKLSDQNLWVLTQLTCLAILFGIVTMNGCAFKDKENQESDFQYRNLKTKFDWNSKGGLPNDEKVKAIRTLKYNGSTGYTTEYITLPEKTPNPLIIINEISGASLPKIDFVRSKIILKDREYQLNVDVRFDELSSMTLLVNSIESAIIGDKSENGVIQIDLYSGGKVVQTFSYMVRTPPNKFNYNLSDLKASKATATILKNPSAASIKVKKGQMNLLEVISLQNNEDYEVEFELPRKLKGSLVQYVNDRSAVGTDCGRPAGIQYSSNVWNDVLSSDLFLIPINESLISESFRVTESSVQNEKFISKLSPHESINIGIYGLGEKVTSWSENGPIQSNLTNASYVSSCKKECEQVGDHCHGRACRKTLEKNENSDSVQYCWNEVSRENRTVGQERGNVTIIVSDDQLTTNIRYSDLNLSADSEARTFQIFKNSNVVEWAK